MNTNTPFGKYLKYEYTSVLTSLFLLFIFANVLFGPALHLYYLVLHSISSSLAIIYSLTNCRINCFKRATKILKYRARVT